MFLAAVSFYLRLFRGSASDGLDCIPPYVDILESIPSHLLLNITEKFETIIEYKKTVG